MENEPNGAQQMPLPGTPPPQRQPQMTTISAKEFAANFKSKRECYNFLASELDVYLPPYGKCPALAKLTVSFFQIT